MKQLTDYHELPDDEEMSKGLRWDDNPGNPDSSDDRFHNIRDPVESLIHERTGTKVDIYESEDYGTYSVQPKLGGYDKDAVVQPDEPGEMVSAVSSVLTVEEDSLPVCRALAMSFMLGWTMRLNYSDQIRDLEA